MHVTNVSTSYRWEIDSQVRQVVTEHKIDRFDQGNSVTTITERSYLYDHKGAVTPADKGQHVDKLA
jgi:hypothetical protein